MFPTDLLDLSEGERFAVGKTDLKLFSDYPHRMKYGVFLLCVEGSAVLTVNQISYRIEPGTNVCLLMGVMVFLSQVSDDCRCLYFSFSPDMAHEATFRLPPAFFESIVKRPVYHCSGEEREIAELWFRIIEVNYRDRENRFRDLIVRNRLQTFFLELYDKLLRSKELYPSEATSRQTEIFHRFLMLVHEYSATQREVAFYAGKLCISARYLSAVTQRVAQCSAKEIIDHTVVMEIKMLLQSTDLSVQEIAYRLHFPDQSYLGRYFKKQTGESPTAYRLGR